MASDEVSLGSQAPSSGIHADTSNYLPDLPLAEDLQALLGRGYVVESFLGQGGMGAVYKGLQMPLRRPVAIKILQKRQAAGGEDEFAFEERFKREAYAMAALTHPHIVQVYDCGDAGENFLFISMELVEGGDLSDAIKAGTVTPEVALKLIPQICDGLQAAHERGIVHRDIKPANIFLTKDGRAKVADFGLAKKFDAKNTLVTKAGLGMGTPDYAAPEQFDGVEDLDHRADIYSLGVMMYQMLTGRLPRGATFKMPSQLSGVDPRIDSIVQRAMESERDDRYQSTAQIKAELARVTATANAPQVVVALDDTATTASVRPITVTRPVSSSRPVTITKAASQPAMRPVTGAVSGARTARTAAPMDTTGKKPNFPVIGAIAAAVVVVAAMFLLRKSAVSPARSDGAANANAPTPRSTPPTDTLQPATSVEKGPIGGATAPASISIKPGQWTRLGRGELRTSAGQMQGDKLLVPAETYVYSALPAAKNAVVRVKVRRVDDVPFGLRIVQRSDAKSVYAYAAVPTASTPQGMIQVSPNANGSDKKGTQAVCDSLAPGKESTFEFLAVDDHYILIIDGKTVAMYRDGRSMDAGAMHLFSGRGAVELREIEVLVLDALAEDKYPDFVKDSLAKSRAASPASGEGAPLAIKTSDGAAAPAGDFPPGKWVARIHQFEDLPEVHRKGGMVKWEDGWLKPTDPTKGFGFSIPGFTARNMAIRAVMRIPQANWPGGGVVLQTRMSASAGRYEAIPSEGTLVISHLKEPARTILGKGARRVLVTPDRDIPVEMAVVGNQIYARADDVLAARAMDDRLATGNAGLHSKSWIRDLEVMNLDGVPEADALRLISVDEKGNDLHLPDSEKFPPGQWVKVFTQSGQLPPDLQLPPSGVTWDGGWIRYEKPMRLYLPSSLTGNYGVRARFQRDSTKSTGMITLRNQSFVTGDQYRLNNSGGDKFGCESARGRETFPIFKIPAPTAVVSGTEYVLEFGAVGNRLVGRLNDSLVKTASDDRYNTGHAYITGSESTRDVEVINLNGLPEAEALRLLGVDEAGNDVRPQELQRIAQGKMIEAIAAIPEVKPLHDQFLALQSERVTGPFEADLAKLNAGYVGGLERALSDAKAARRADAVVALEAEKTLITSRQPLPQQDDEKTGDTLKKLRGIYRGSRASLEAQREARLKALTGPLQTRLSALAADFTAKGRDADAKVVQEFMATLSADTPMAATAPPKAGGGSTPPSSAGGATTSLAQARNITPADPRAAAEWVLSLGGTVDVDDRGTRRTIRSLDELPKGRIDVLRVWLDKAKILGNPTGTFTSLEPIAGLKKLTHLEIHFYDVLDVDADVLASLPALTSISIDDAKKFTGEKLGQLRDLEDLDMLHLGSSGITRRGLEAIATLKRVTKMDLSNTPLTDEDLSALADMKNLRMLTIRSIRFSAAGLSHLKKLDGLTEMGWRFEPGKAVDDGKVLSLLFPRLTTLTMETARDLPGSEISASLAHLPKLQKVIFSNGPAVTDEQGQALAGVQTLTSIAFASGPAITDATFQALAYHKNLKSLRVDGGSGWTRAGLMALVRLKPLSRLELHDTKQLDDTAITEFKRQRPDVNVSE